MGGAGPAKRVMIVEDSPTVRLLLEDIIGGDPRLEIVASVGSAEEALALLHTARPDVISLDIRLPGMDGFQATRRIMAERPTPIVVVSASVDAEDLKISMNALNAGALAVLEKPTLATGAEYSALAQRLCRQLLLMSDVPVITRHERPAATRPRLAPPPVAPLHPPGYYRLLGIVASTGGPNALVSLFKALGPDWPLPILLVQHITPSFLPGFVAWLDDIIPLRAAVARDDEVPRPGHVYLAPADGHLEIDGPRLRVTDGPPVSSQKPSGTILLRSIARSYGSRALAVLLTGMGDDGALGLKEIRDAGGYTIAQDQATSVVYGMPGTAVRLGAAVEELALAHIGPRLLQIALREEVAT
jgi:two-component system chemotaxis response regulator CheB